MSEKHYVVIQAFKGSPTGATVIEFNVGDEVDEFILGKDLLAVCLAEEWISEGNPEPEKMTSVANYIHLMQPATKSVIHNVINAIYRLDKANPSYWTRRGVPKPEPIKK